MWEFLCSISPVYTCWIFCSRDTHVIKMCCSVKGMARLLLTQRLFSTSAEMPMVLHSGGV